MLSRRPSAVLVGLLAKMAAFLALSSCAPLKGIGFGLRPLGVGFASLGEDQGWEG